MSPRAARLSSVLAASTMLTGLTGIAHAAQPAAHPRASMATYDIGISVPLLQLPDLAYGISHGVDVAIAEANTKHTIPGVTINPILLDDTLNGKYSGSKDATNARQFINNVHVIGEVGPLNSGADKVSEPVYNANGLVQISPSNTAIELTAPSKRALYEPTTANTNSPITYFRTCTTDAYQGPAGAIYAREHGFKTVYVTDNKGTYGIGLAATFKAEALKIGLNVLGSGELDPNNLATSAQQLAATIATKKPGLVYFGGEYGSQGGAELFADDLRRAGLKTVTFMGGDGILAQAFINGSSAGGANGALATTVGGDPTKDPNARAFLAAEKAQFPKTTVQAYDTYAYDATNAIINAFARAVKNGSIKVGAAMDRAHRLVIARQVRSTDFQGASGPVSFNANGDSLNHTIGVYKVINGKFVFQSVAPKVQ